MQCQLKPLSAADYAVTFTAAQWARPAGGVPDRRLRLDEAERRRAADVPWLTFAGGPGGQPLGAAPVSK